MTERGPLAALWAHGDIIEYDEQNRWLVVTQPSGASAIYARDVDPLIADMVLAAVRREAKRPLRDNERHAMEAILDRTNADPDDDAAIVARAAQRCAEHVLRGYVPTDFGNDNPYQRRRR